MARLFYHIACSIFLELKEELMKFFIQEYHSTQSRGGLHFKNYMEKRMHTEPLDIILHRNRNIYLVHLLGSHLCGPTWGIFLPMPPLYSPRYTDQNN